MQQKLSWYSLAPILKNLRIGGFYQLDPKTTSRKKFFCHQIYMRVCLLVPVLYTIQEIVYIYQVRSDPNKVMDSMFLMLSFTDMIFKQVMLWLKADKVEEILDIMKGSLFNQENPSHIRILSKTAKTARISLRVFNAMTLITTFLWTTFPLIEHLNNNDVDFAIWLPFDINGNSGFYYVLFYVWIQTTLFGLNNSTTDMLVTFFYAQCKAQLSILRINLENLAEHSVKKASNEKIPYSKALAQTFVKSLQHYNAIIRCNQNVQHIFGTSLLFQLMVTEWIICTTAYRTIHMDLLSIEFLSMVFYLSCVLTEIFLFCFYGNQVLHESERLTESAYNMNWLDTPLEYRRSLIIFLERLKRPIEPIAGIIVPLSLNTFVMILKGSYTFYAFLKTSEH